MNDQDYRDKVVEHMAQTRTELKAIKADIAEIKSGAACPVGVKAIERITALTASEKEQWDAINGIRNPVRTATLYSAGSGGVIGATVMWLVRDVIPRLMP